MVKEKTRKIQSDFLTYKLIYLSKSFIEDQLIYFNYMYAYNKVGKSVIILLRDQQIIVFADQEKKRQ